MKLFPRGINATCVVVCLLFSTLTSRAFAEPVEQDTIQAAMTLQILAFTEWPEVEENAKSELKTIGIMNSEDAFSAFESLLADSRFAGRFRIIAIDSGTATEELHRCDAIFFSDPDPTEIPRIIKKLEKHPIVMIGTFEGFLEQGGLVNLVKRQRKLGFEIHMDNSKRRGIGYRAKLLRLAARIEQE